MGARQKSGEGVMRRNGCPKECFWRVRFFSAPLRFSGPSSVLRENLKGAEKKRTLQKHPFGQPLLRTTPSPLLWRALILIGAIKSTHFFCTMFFENPSAHGHPRRKSWTSAPKCAFFCGCTSDGENFFCPRGIQVYRQISSTYIRNSKTIQECKCKCKKLKFVIN